MDHGFRETLPGMLVDDGTPGPVQMLDDGPSEQDIALANLQMQQATLETLQLLLDEVRDLRADIAARN